MSCYPPQYARVTGGTGSGSARPSRTEPAVRSSSSSPREPHTATPCLLPTTERLCRVGGGSTSWEETAAAQGAGGLWPPRVTGGGRQAGDPPPRSTAFAPVPHWGRLENAKHGNEVLSHCARRGRTRLAAQGVGMATSDARARTRGTENRSGSSSSPMHRDHRLHEAITGHLEEFLDRRSASVTGLDTDFAAEVFGRLAGFVLDGGKRIRPIFAWWGWRAGGGTDDG